MTKTHNPEICALCGSVAATTVMTDHEFDYRHGGKMVTLNVSVPVTECSACDEAYFCEGAEELKHEAVCNYLGRLTPREIVELRQRLNMSQAQLATMTGIGVASIKRWETGVIIQNAALDLQLQNLESTIKGELQSPWAGNFRTPFSEGTKRRALKFALRPIRDQRNEAMGCML